MIWRWIWGTTGATILDKAHCASQRILEGYAYKLFLPQRFCLVRFDSNAKEKKLPLGDAWLDIHSRKMRILSRMDPFGVFPHTRIQGRWIQKKRFVSCLYSAPMNVPVHRPRRKKLCYRSMHIILFYKRGALSQTPYQLEVGCRLKSLIMIANGKCRSLKAKQAHFCSQPSSKFPEWGHQQKSETGVLLSQNTTRPNRMRVSRLALEVIIPLQEEALLWR